MSEACVIDFNGKRYVFYNRNEEPRQYFIERCWFKVKYSKSDCEIPLESLSHIWINQKYRGIMYDNKINMILASVLNT